VVALIDHSSWQVVSPEADPLASERPAEVSCEGLAAWGQEGDHLEVNTAFCNYLMLEQPALVGAPAGAVLVGTASHFDLTAPAPATARIVILIGGRVVWEESVAIPGPAAVYSIQRTLAEPISGGEPIYFHVRNHGQNNFRLYDLGVATTH
jgi:hypothetical protein